MGIKMGWQKRWLSAGSWHWNGMLHELRSCIRESHINLNRFLSKLSHELLIFGCGITGLSWCKWNSRKMCVCFGGKDATQKN